MHEANSNTIKVPAPSTSQKVSSEFSTCLVIHNFQEEHRLSFLNNPFKTIKKKKHLCRHKMARPRVEASTAESFRWLFQLAPLTLGALWFLESNLRFLPPKHLGFFGNRGKSLTSQSVLKNTGIGTFWWTIHHTSKNTSVWVFKGNSLNAISQVDMGWWSYNLMQKRSLGVVDFLHLHQALQYFCVALPDTPQNLTHPHHIPQKGTIWKGHLIFQPSCAGNGGSLLLCWCKRKHSRRVPSTDWSTSFHGWYGDFYTTKQVDSATLLYWFMLATASIYMMPAVVFC